MLVICVISIAVAIIAIAFAYKVSTTKKANDLESLRVYEQEKEKIAEEVRSLNSQQSELMIHIANNAALNEQYEQTVQDKRLELSNIEKDITTERSKYQTARSEYDKQKTLVDSLYQQEKLTRERIDNLGRAAESAYDKQKEMAGRAFENYCDILSKTYEEKTAEYETLSRTLEKSYANKQNELMEEASQLQNQIAEIQKELDTIRQSRAAAMEAIQREQFVKDNLSAYSLLLSDIDKSDVSRLEDVCIALSAKAQRTLHMLIWQTYFQKNLKTLSTNQGVIGTTGIYKITNIETGQCYIGQAVDIGSRWSQHCKCMLGIDTPVGNKLYKAASRNVWNFSWELLEECAASQLNEREAYYIDMYNAYDFGYNSTKGNKH